MNHLERSIYSDSKRFRPPSTHVRLPLLSIEILKRFVTDGREVFFVPLYFIAYVLLLTLCPQTMRANTSRIVKQHGAVKVSPRRSLSASPFPGSSRLLPSLTLPHYTTSGLSHDASFPSRSIQRGPLPPRPTHSQRGPAGKPWCVVAMATCWFVTKFPRHPAGSPRGYMLVRHPTSQGLQEGGAQPSSGVPSPPDPPTASVHPDVPS